MLRVPLPPSRCGYGCGSGPNSAGKCNCVSWETGPVTWCGANKDQCNKCNTKDYGHGVWCPGGIAEAPVENKGDNKICKYNCAGGDCDKCDGSEPNTGTWCSSTKDRCEGKTVDKRGRPAPGCGGAYCPAKASGLADAGLVVTEVKKVALALEPVHVTDEWPLMVDNGDGTWAPCPCHDGTSNWPPSCPPSGFNGACCHGNVTCETQNWSKKTCTPAFGTWCTPPPPGYCPCGPGCPPKGAPNGGACCHGNRTCETVNWTPKTCTPAYGSWCPSK